MSVYSVCFAEYLLYWLEILITYWTDSNRFTLLSRNDGFVCVFCVCDRERCRRWRHMSPPPPPHHHHHHWCETDGPEFLNESHISVFTLPVVVGVLQLLSFGVSFDSNSHPKAWKLKKHTTITWSHHSLLTCPRLVKRDLLCGPYTYFKSKHLHAVSAIYSIFSTSREHEASCRRHESEVMIASFSGV